MTSAGLVIRDAEAADIAAVRALLVETWHATYDGIYGWRRVAEITNAWHSLENLHSQLGRGEGVFLVGLIGEEIVATASARSERDGAALLTRLYVLPAWQGVGIGRTLLQVALACFPLAPVARLEVESQNEAAIAFYERMGFFLQRQARFDGRDDTPNTLLMARRLFVE
ncbi:GNAT family N-acetyltransferase [Bosea sp. (in: a-proteobacteria)]|uniref:GNAT family N-acetyltransferase n=1 Tax=Bosea sp. (in: a-proteobacteria) TaxID=1871050 RepID=UPI0033410F85